MRRFLVFVFVLQIAHGAPADPVAAVKLRAHPEVRPRDQEEAGLRFNLKQAEAYALANHPQIAAADLNANAVRQEISEARSAFFPQVYGESDSVWARNGDTRLAATASLSNSAVYTRQSDGVVLNQLITDFGRTYELTESARSQAAAASDRAAAARALVILMVDRAYFDVLRSHALLAVAGQTVKARDLAFRQISALAKASLRSALDVDFAQVNLSQGQMMEIDARSALDQAEAQLSTALGFPDAQHFVLTEEPLQEALASSSDALIQEAINQRPELANLRHKLDAAQRFAKAQEAARYPKISALAAAGINPIAPMNVFQHTYYSAGVNVEVPITTGGRLSAQAQEASLLARAASDDLIDAQNTISRDVRVAWLNAKTAYERIGVADEMVRAADRAQLLAKARYSLGTSSIVEFTQAQLNYTEAEMQDASAKYDYQIDRALLDFAAGSSFPDNTEWQRSNE